MIIKEKITKYLRKKITDPDYAFEVKKNDVFIISYPKSGNTWVRFLLAGLITEEEDVKDYNIEENIPDVCKIGHKKFYRKNKINVFKTHSYYRPKFANNKVIYLVRDPRDVLISYFNFYNKRRENKISLDYFLNLFLQGRIDYFGNWGGHVGGWLGAKDDSADFLLVGYEDLLIDTKKELKKIIDFLSLGGSFPEKKISKIIENCSLKNLKKNEKRILAPPKNISKITKNKPYFFNKGKVKQWEKFLDKKQAEKIEKKFKTLIKQLKYPIDKE